MASKIFSDLPEVATNIVQNLRNDIKSLYSCVLVNSALCNLTIPLLWENPFSIKYQKNLSYHFIDTYFLFLNDDDKNKIKEFYKFDSNLYKPLFNYPSLLKTLNLFRIQLHVLNWLNSTTGSIQQSSNKRSHFPLTFISYHSHDESYEEFKLVRNNRSNGKIQTICIILLKLFMENEVILNDLYLNMDPKNRFFKNFYEIISNNPTFISHIETFKLSLPKYDEYEYDQYYHETNIFQMIQPFLPSSIKHMDLEHVYEQEFEEIFTNVIQRQSQLSSIRIGEKFLFDSSKYVSNNLTSIGFHPYYLYSNDLSFDEFSRSTQLESLQFNDCKLGLLSKTLRIKSLVITETRFLKTVSVELFIQKVGCYVENLVLSIYNENLRKKLFDAIIDSCERIKFLHLDYINFENIPQLSKMLSKFYNCLKYITLEFKSYNYKHFSYNVSLNDNDNDLNISSMILKELSKSLPPSLYYLDLNLVINPDDLQILFDNCNQVNLKRLLVRNRSTRNLDITLNVIKNFIKGKDLEFLAYGIRKNPKCLKNLKNLAKEIQSFVEMRDYNDLVIKVDSADGSLIESC